MRYHEAADFLLDLRRFRMRPGTESVRALLAEVGDPHREFVAVQVAGSNGKGSTARMVESVLRAAGLDVGLYTSPHFDLDAHVSVDTRKAAVAEPALDAGADIVNDVSGLADPRMRHVAADHDAGLVVMHSIDTPVDRDNQPEYDDVVADVRRELREPVLLAEKAGVDRSRMLVDPGLGFGKYARESFELLSRLGELRSLGCPVMVGHSHKSMFGLVGEQAGDCLDATVASTALAVQRGADVVRVHDVAENLPAVRTAEALADPQGYE